MLLTKRFEAGVDVLVLCVPPFAVLNLEDVMLGVVHDWGHVGVGHGGSSLFATDVQ
jgi:hypothetical protein